MFPCNKSNSVKLRRFQAGIIVVALAFSVRCALAQDTIAEWSFPTNAAVQPAQPFAASVSYFSTNDLLGWTAPNSKLNESYGAGNGSDAALEFSYNGNHADYLNGLILAFTVNVSGLPSDSTLDDFQLSYYSAWDKSGDLTQTWS